MRYNQVKRRGRKRKEKYSRNSFSFYSLEEASAAYYCVAIVM
jgi:hypothetical protein